MLPVVFLAFANDKGDAGAGFLRGLTAERNGIRDALGRAEQLGLCQVIVEPDVTVNRIFDVFQNPQYKDRIAIFHYGGHAESYSLLLESATGENATAHSEGLVRFLAKQKSLQLAFLNGCSSKKQAEELVEAGLPAVIGTSQSINDSIAIGLAVRFYKGLAAGMPLERAWTDSVDQVKTETDTTQTRALHRTGVPAERTEAMPWKLYFAENGTHAREWNFPEAAKQPLFGLELPKSSLRNLPLSPYPGLRSFRPEEAAVFFGRGNDIRRLHTHLKGMQPLILFSGKKGVGKSSLLQAGFLPRVENEYHVLYTDAAPASPLQALANALIEHASAAGISISQDGKEDERERKLSELQSSLAHSQGFARLILQKEIELLGAVPIAHSESPAALWRSLEEKYTKPLLLAIDEAGGSAEDWKSFASAVQTIFQGESECRGKLIVCADAEMQAGIAECLNESHVAFSDVFLQPLDWEGVTEAISGAHQSVFTRDYYRSEIENTEGSSLPQTLSADLLNGGASLCAPFLQVIMKGLWDLARQEDPKAPALSLRRYQTEKQSGTLLGDFFLSQIGQLKEANAEALNSGLLLDVLNLHVSALGTAQFVSQERIRQVYGPRQEAVRTLMRECQSLYLLTGSDEDGYSLSHDLLAPVVIRHHSNSLLPGQQATRILNAKTEESHTDKKKIWLNEGELEVVEKGLSGMRALSAYEEELLQFSRAKKIQLQRERKRNRSIRTVLAFAIALFALLAGWQWRVSRQNYLYSRAGELAFLSKSILKKDNTLALDIAREAYGILQKHSPPAVSQTLSEVFHSQEFMPLYSASFPHLKKVNSAVFSPDGTVVLTASEDGTAKLWDLNGKEILSLPHVVEVRMARFSPNGKQILTQTIDSLRLWERDGKLVWKEALTDPAKTLDEFTTDGTRIIPGTAQYRNAAIQQIADSLHALNDRLIISPDEKHMLGIYGGAYLAYIRLYDEHGTVLKDSLDSLVTDAAFSPDGKLWVYTTEIPGAETSKIHVEDFKYDTVFVFDYRGKDVKVKFTPDNQGLLTAANDFTAKRWNFSQPFLHRFPRQKEAISAAAFHPAGNGYLTAGFDSTVRLWDENGILLNTLAHNDVVVSAAFSGDGKRILSASNDSTARIWIPGESKTIVLRHESPVSKAAFSHDGSLILTTSGNAVYVWTANGVKLDSHPHAMPVLVAEFRPDDKAILSVSSDSLVQEWEFRGRKTSTYKHPSDVYSAVYSPDGKTLLSTCADSVVRLWSREGNILQTFSHPDAMKALFSPDGKRIFTAFRTVRIWDLKGNMQDSLLHSGNVLSISFSPDAAQILTTTEDSSAFLWNDRFQQLAQYRKHTRPVVQGCFSPDGKHVLTASSDGYVIRWRTPDAIFESLKSSLYYHMSRKERAQYHMEE